MKRFSCRAKDHGTKLIGVQRRLCSVAGGVLLGGLSVVPETIPKLGLKKKGVKAARRARCPCFLPPFRRYIQLCGTLPMILLRHRYE
jgi:hypothetical protein